MRQRRPSSDDARSKDKLMPTFQEEHDLFHKSTSDDTISSEETPTEERSQLKRVHAACEPIVELFVSNGQSEFETFLIESLAGLTGTDTVRTYPCLLQDKIFYVLVGDTPLRLFTKSTFMNLADFAEARKAETMIFVLD